ncbi:unnamed protein product, partial [Mesorhabditis spiculigera]
MAEDPEFDGVDAEEQDLAVSEAGPSTFEITQRVEVSAMANMFLTKTGILFSAISLNVYLFGDLAIYSTTVPKSMMNMICDSINTSTVSHDDPCHGNWPLFFTRFTVYRLCVFLFIALCLPMIVAGVTKTKYLQLATSVSRWTAFSLMIVLASMQLAQEGAEASPPMANFHGFGSLFGVTVYAFMCHHSLPSLVTPMSSKSRLFLGMGGIYSIVLLFYFTLSLTGAFAFKHVQDVLFPIFTLTTNYPIVGITLINNIKVMKEMVFPTERADTEEESLLETTDDELPEPRPRSRSLRTVTAKDFLIPVLVLGLPTMISLFTDDVLLLAAITGSYPGRCSMKLSGFLLFLVIPTVTANLWLPFANFGTMFGAIREAAFGSRDPETQESTGNPLTYFALAGRELLHNLQKMFMGDEPEENGTDYEIPEAFRELPTEFPQETLTTEEPYAERVYTFGPPTTEEVPVVPRTYLPGFKFTFPYTTPHWMSTTRFPTIGPIKPRVWTRPMPSSTFPITTTTTTPERQISQEETTMRPVPLTWTPYPQASKSSEEKMEWTTSTQPSTSPQWARVAWKTPEFTTPTTSTLMSVRERMTRPTIRKVTPTPSSRPIYPTTQKEKEGSTCDMCKPGRLCKLRLRSFETSDPVFQYAYSHSTMIDDNMQGLLRETQMYYFPPPLSWKNSASPEVIQLTQTLMQSFRPSRCLIAGMFTGLSVIGIGSNIDSRGIIVALEYPEFVQYWEKIGMKHAQKHNLMSKIQVRSGDTIDRSLQKLAANEPNTFDLIFLDDYRKQNYLDDYEYAVNLARPGGLLIINEALNGGSVMSPQETMSADARAVRNMNIRIKQDIRVRATLLPFSGGTWVITKV